MAAMRRLKREVAAAAVRPVDSDAILMRIVLITMTIAVIAGLLLAPAPAEAAKGAVGRTVTNVAGGNIQIVKEECYTVAEGEERVEDIYLFAECMNVVGTLDGDAVAFVGEAYIPGVVTQDANVFTQMLSITGEVGDDVRAVCEDLTISGRVEGDVIAACADFKLQPGAVIEGDLLLAAGKSALEGEVLGKAHIVTGYLNLNGTIAGNAEIQTDGGISVGGEANIGGDLHYEGPYEVAGIAERVSGEVTYSKLVEKGDGLDFEFPAGLGYFFHFLGFIAALIAGSIIVALTKDHARRTAEIIRTKPLKSLGIGFVAFICIPVVLLILLVLVLTIPLMFVVMFAYFIALYIAKFYFSIWLGNLILGRSGRTDVSPIPGMLLGLLIVYLVTAIPILGTLAGIVIIFFGLGALLQRKETRLDSAFEPAPVQARSNGLPNSFSGTGTGA